MSTKPGEAQLLLEGRWDYQETGLLDRTHLRFFTKATIREMFEGAGFTVEQITPVNVTAVGKAALANRLSGGHLTEFMTLQWVVVASL